MLRCSRLSRAAFVSATALRRAAASTSTTNPAATPSQVPAHSSGENGSASAPEHSGKGALQHSDDAGSHVPSPHVETPPPPPPPQHHQPKFFFKGRRGSITPEYYSTRSNAGHPDAVAELLGARRDDPEWMWLKLLCFLCTMATFGTTLYGYFFAEHVKYFKDEPWSPFAY